MKLFLTTILIVTCVGVGLVLGAQNEELVTLNYVIGTIELHMSTLMTLLVGIGLVIGLIIGAISIASLKVQNALLRRKLNTVTQSTN